jgi:hypothetical protein
MMRKSYEGKNKKGFMMENMTNIMLWILFLLIAGFAIFLAVKFLFFKSAA